MRYLIVSDRVAGRRAGATVVLDMPQARIDALVRAGHVVPVPAEPPPVEGSEGEV